MMLRSRVRKTIVVQRASGQCRGATRSAAKTHELNIMTNDGWVVTLISDRRLDLGDAILTSIIVQPKADHDARVPGLRG